MDMDHPQVIGGWPLGLENMNSRLRAIEALQVAITVQNSNGVRSDSSSSYTSSELDSESTRSSLLDRSVTLGKLIGINDGEGDLYFTNSALSDESDVPMVNASPDVMRRRSATFSCFSCTRVPLISDVLAKIGPGKISSK